ncbi:glycosyltransferase family 4 protein [Bacteroides sp. AN502(2024)]|uniref:glycosyltransferase family 4 protein n=1 Tax=Bacteroides sp. AN502(2024) TaxID=3160599 RepID=UPI0035154032
MSKSILYLGGFELPDKNAAAQRVMANAKLLQEMDFEVSFIGISKDIKNAPKEVNGFESNPIPYAQGTKQWMHQIFTFVETSAILERRLDYVVLYNFPAVASLRILKACHKKGIKVVHDLTEWEATKGWSPRTIIRNWDINLRMRYCMKKMDGVIAISRYLYEYYKPYTNVILVPPTVDLTAEKWNRIRVLEAGKKIRLVYAGNAGFGVKDRLDIIAKTVVKHPNMQMDVIGMTEEDYTTGYGPLPERCNNIIFHGRVPHMEAVKAVQDADFQFLIRDSNLKNNAGFPTKFVESMACCTPIIGTLTSNIGDYLKDGVNGFIVDNNHSLDDVLERISKLSSAEIVTMKEFCKNVKAFDYRVYKSVFGTIFK